MSPDDKVCYCYGVSLRKLLNYARRERPKVASQLSECLGAGTGCGWCIPVLCRIAADPDGFAEGLEAAEYATRRRSYLASGQKNRFDSPPEGWSSGGSGAAVGGC